MSIIELLFLFLSGFASGAVFMKVKKYVGRYISLLDLILKERKRFVSDLKPEILFSFLSGFLGGIISAAIITFLLNFDFIIRLARMVF